MVKKLMNKDEYWKLCNEASIDKEYFEGIWRRILCKR